MRTLLQAGGGGGKGRGGGGGAGSGGGADAAAGDAADALPIPDIIPPPSSTPSDSQPPPDSSSDPPPDSPSSPSSTPPPTPSSPPPSPSSPPPSPPIAPPPAPEESSPPPPEESSPPPPVASSAPPPAEASPPPPTEASSPPPPESQPPPPPSSVPSAPPPSPTATPPPSPDNAAPPPSPLEAPPPPRSAPSPQSHAKPPSSKESPPPPASEPPGSTPVDATPPPPQSPGTYAPPPSTRTNTSAATARSPPGSALTPPVNADRSVPSPSPPSSGGMSSGATAGVAVVAVIAFICFAGVFVCLTKRRKRKYSDQYYPRFGQAPPYLSPHMSGEAPFLHVPSSGSGSMNFSGPGGNQPGMSPMASQAYAHHQQQQQQQQQRGFVSANYSSTMGSQQGPGRSVAASGELSVGNSRSFSFDELYEITGGFSRDKLLGEGGFGCVFKGTLGDGREVAVKQLKGGGGQGEREFQAEVEIISRVHHRHLVSLVGYCISEDHRLLVYDFVANDTMHHNLHGRGRPVMDWPTRVKIAAGSARGLAYLHEDCHPRIIHRDIKSSNILLDDNFEAQVADFGLARLAENDVTHVSTRVMGTFGYLAPEYASTGKLTEKSDVFSFGVVLLELITGRKPVDSSRPLGDESLVEWSRPLLNRAIDEQEFEELVDPRLDGNFDDVEMFRVIEAAAACIRHSAARRPKMGQVVRILDSLTLNDVDLTNGVQPGKSQMFNVANTADIKQFQRMAFGSQDFSSEYTQSRASMNGRRDL